MHCCECPRWWPWAEAQHGGDMGSESAWLLALLELCLLLSLESAEALHEAGWLACALKRKCSRRMLLLELGRGS